MRLAILAERIAKLHAQLGQGVLVDRSRRALAEAVREFDATLRAIAALVTAGEARESYLLLRLLWPEYRAWVSKPPTRENVRKMAERADEVAWVAAKGARLLEARTPTRPLARQAERACVLAQRVPRLHLMRRWQPRDEALAGELHAASAELARTLEALASAPLNTPEIVAELQVAENQHVFLARAAREVAEGGAAPASFEVIAKTGDHILESLQRAARVYRGLPA